MRQLMVPAAWLLVALGCEETDPCDEYVDYMCECHANDEGFDCQALRNTYADADPAVQDQCAVALREQEDADAANGYVCGEGGDTDAR